jgi:FlaA1/EpsC-like NDP-sugar epimerase
MNFEKLEKNRKVAQLLELNHETFSILLVTFLLLLLAETIWAGSVSAYMNINYFLIVVIISGVMSILTRKEEEKVEKVDLTKKDYFYIGALGAAGSLIILYKIKDIGNPAYLISFIAGALIILLSLLIFKEDEKDG